MSVDQNFDSWLVKKLESLDIDDEILGSYINSVVTSDDSYSEKKETLKDIMLGVTQQDLDIDSLCAEVLDKWSEFRKSSSSNETEEKTDVAHKVALIMEQQAQSVLKVVNRSSEEEKLREAILSRCTYVSSEEEDAASEHDGAVSTTSQNQNVEAIVQADKERRDKLKAEAEKKKAQDKVNREKQKQKQDERREKERKRTQKREHKR